MPDKDIECDQKKWQRLCRASERESKKLLEQLRFNTNVSDPIDTNKAMEPSRDRFEVREVAVYDDLYDISHKRWTGIQEIVKVTRTTHLSKRDAPSVDVSFYLSSKKMSAKEYNYGIRAHWTIENSLHYVKDVTFGEDASLIRTGNAPTNFSIIRNIAINIFRRCDFISMRQAVRMLGGDIKELGKLLA